MEVWKKRCLPVPDSFSAGAERITEFSVFVSAL